ncbi:MAG: hypothetical protein LZF62_240268 [Nitrospira sp.]|nr:MAG: hypothetical protein LZF62_240268 [Nitrospira sp.]
MAHSPVSIHTAVPVPTAGVTAMKLVIDSGSLEARDASFGRFFSALETRCGQIARHR